MYSSYNHHLSVEITSTDNEIQRLENYLTTLNNSIKQIEDLPSIGVQYKAILNSYKVDKKGIEKKISNLTIKKIELTSNVVTLEEYKFIARAFNKSITQRMIETGYKLKIGGFGSLRIVSRRKIDQVKRRVDWGVSNRFKKQIEEKGQIPFKAIYEEIDGKKVKVGDNGGVEWLIKRTSPYEIFWIWEKVGCYIINQSLYKMNFTKHMKLAINTLASKDPSIFIRYI